MARPTSKNHGTVEHLEARRVPPVIFSVIAERYRWSLRRVATAVPMKMP